MAASFQLKNDTFVIKNFNQARPFSSFLPGIAGPYGKPMWVFYTNRGQCIASFGVRNKDGAILEFNPATKAYQDTPFLGFRTFIRLREGKKEFFYEPFRLTTDPAVRQNLSIRPHEIELESTHAKLGLSVTIRVFNAPNLSLPLLVRDIQIESTKRGARQIEVLDGLPRLVPFGLREMFNKQMTRTMEAFSEIVHVSDRLPLFKMKVEPDDKPEVQWVQGGAFAFTIAAGKSLPIFVDSESIFGSDTSFQEPLGFQTNARWMRQAPRTESFFGSAFSFYKAALKPGEPVQLQAYYGQTDAWEKADELRRRLEVSSHFSGEKRAESARLVKEVGEGLAISSESDALNAYSRQTFLDNTLRGGMPYLIAQPKGTEVFHFYSRKHGDMERDYNFFELAPTYFSQGNGNFRDVNQNRRSEVLLYAGMKSGNVETFFNLIQLDGYNPMVLQSERFYLEKDQLAGLDERVAKFVVTPFQPGALFERLLDLYPRREEAQDYFQRILSKAKKIQEAVHGEGFWVDHWMYNLDLLENFLAVYPDELKSLLVGQRQFTYYDNAHTVQPRNKKYIRRADGSIRQLHSVQVDNEKQKRIRKRSTDPHKVRIKEGEGAIFQTTLLVKMLGLVGVKLSTLDPFGIGIEMEAEKPGWCDAMNGLPGLLGSSINETLALRRWLTFLQEHLPEILASGESHTFPVEMIEFLKAVGEALAIARPGDFYKTWDTLASLRERFRERTRFGLSGDEAELAREELAAFLATGLRVIEDGIKRAVPANGLMPTYFINEPVRYELLPLAVGNDPTQAPVQTVKVLEFKQIPISPFLEGPVHALRSTSSVSEARKIYSAVKNSDLYDRKLKMFKLNVPLVKESYEIGRSKIFTPGWLENESVFLHMAYKFVLETLRSGLVEEFYEDFKTQCVGFLDPQRYGRSPLENSSFIVSSRFPDARLHGNGFSARLTGAAAEWISFIMYIGLGSQPFKWVKGELRFEPRPTLAGWLFRKKATALSAKDTFGFKLFGKTWIIYHNPGRKNTYGPKALLPKRYRLRTLAGKETVHEGTYLPDALARDLRSGELEKIEIDLA